MADPQGGSTSGRLKLFTRRPKKARETAGAAARAPPDLPARSSPWGIFSLFSSPASPPTPLSGQGPRSAGAPLGSAAGGAPRPPLLYRMRGAFSFLLALNLVLGGYMLFRGKALLKDAARMPDTAELDDEKKRKNEEKAGGESATAVAAAAGAAGGTAATDPATATATAPGIGSEEGSHAASSSAPKRTSEMQSWDMEAMVGPAGVTVTGDGADDGAGEGSGVTGLAFTGGQVSKIDLDGQLEVLKWILDVKRKEQVGVTREERRRIDEQKRLLKDYIKAKKHLPLDL